MEQSEHESRDILEQLTQYHAPLRWAPLAPSDTLEDMGQHPVRAEDALAYLHAHRMLPSVDQTETGGGIRGRLLKRLAYRTQRVMGPRMHQEQDLLLHLIHMTETLASRCDDLTNALAAQQVQEAASQARLAGWLDAALTAGETTPR
jgi:hypothetical protein